MNRLLLSLGVIALLASAFAFRPSPDEAPPDIVTVTGAGHAVNIEYHSTRGAWRPATVTVRIQRGAQTPWRGALRSIRFDGLRSATDADRRQSRGLTPSARVSSQTMSARILAPAPENLRRIWFKAESREVTAVLIQTEAHNLRSYGDGDTDPPPKDPEEPVNPGQDPDNPGDDFEEDWGDECPQPPGGCVVYDMNSCICVQYAETDGSSWSDPARTQGANTGFGF